MRLDSSSPENDIASLPTFDPQIAMEALEDDGVFLKELIGIFLSQVPSIRGHLSDLTSKMTFAEFHELATSCRIVGALRCAYFAKAVEEGMRQQIHHDSGEIRNQAIALLDETSAALEQWLERFQLNLP